MSGDKQHFVGNVQFGPARSLWEEQPSLRELYDQACAGLIRGECEAEELRAEAALLKEQARILAQERDEAREAAEKAKAYKRVLKETNAQLKRERDEAREAFAIATSNCVDAQQRLREMEDQRNFAMGEMERLLSMSVCELTAHNDGVRDYVAHWEGRTLAAEAEVARLTKQIAGNVTAMNERYAEVQAVRTERDEARVMLERKWAEQDPPLIKMMQERDEARIQYRSTEALGMALVKTLDELKTEKAAILAQLVSLQAGSRRATLDEIAESVREKYEPEHEGEEMDNE